MRVVPSPKTRSSTIRLPRTTRSFRMLPPPRQLAERARERARAACEQLARPAAAALHRRADDERVGLRVVGDVVGRDARADQRRNPYGLGDGAHLVWIRGPAGGGAAHDHAV